MRPTARCLILFLGGVPAGLAPVLVDARLWILWLSYLGSSILLAGLDAVLSLPPRRLHVTHDIPEAIFIGDDSFFEIRVQAPLAIRSFLIEVLHDLDEDFQSQPLQRMRVLPGTAATATVRLSPKRRGTKRVESFWLRWSGPLGLFCRIKVGRISAPVAVKPNIAAVRRDVIKFLSTQTWNHGLKSERYVGDGSEFESLREYVPGLDHRAIHWKASARHRKLYVRNFRAERNHELVFAIDSGHLMREPIAGIPKIDHAIHLGLLLGYFGLRTGDRVGAFGFDDQVRHYAKPSSGLRSFARLQNTCAKLDYSAAETNFTVGLTELSARLRRRALVVLLTDFVDTITAEVMIENMSRLARRHVVVFVTLRDHDLDRTVLEEPADERQLYRAVVAQSLLRERELVLKRLGRLGVHCIDAQPQQVSVALLNRYFDIKRRELL